MAKLIQDLSIGGNLRKLREARGLTQEDVCARMAQLGRPMLQSAYSQIETGRRNLFVLHRRRQKRNKGQSGGTARHVFKFRTVRLRR